MPSEFDSIDLKPHANNAEARKSMLRSDRVGEWLRIAFTRAKS